MKSEINISTVFGLEKWAAQVRLGTDYDVRHRAAYTGRATLVLDGGAFSAQVYPTADELRELAAACLAAAESVEAA